MSEGLDTSFASTRAGLFSLLVFRQIHFNSKAFVSCPAELRKVKFTTLVEYKDYVASLYAHFPDEAPSFFCNPSAHGSPVPERTIERADDYWNAAMSADLQWPPARQFATAYKTMQSYKTNLRPENKPFWSGLGSLTLFQLMLDVHFAGLVDEPTLDDMADIAGYLQKGAWSGLSCLKYVNNVHNKHETCAQFRRFYEDMCQALSVEQKAQFGWNPVICEHALCKFSRMFKRGFYN